MQLGRNRIDVTTTRSRPGQCHNDPVQDKPTPGTAEPEVTHEAPDTAPRPLILKEPHLSDIRGRIRTYREIGKNGSGV